MFSISFLYVGDSKKVFVVLCSTGALVNYSKKKKFFQRTKRRVSAQTHSVTLTKTWLKKGILPH